MKNNFILSICLFLSFFGKQYAQNESNDGKSFTTSIEKAHEQDKFNSNNAVAYTLKLSFGGSPRIDAKITQLTDGSKIRIDYADGKTVIFDGSQVYGFPKTADFKGARFDIFTWSYFFALPYKLNDGGTNWANTEKHKWGGTDYPTNKLTFNDGVGDTPDDWYIIYKNPESSLLEGAAYIVSYGKDLAKAEADPHAIKYANFTTTNEVPFATQWTFHNWNLEKGYTDQLGEGTLSNIEFVKKEASFFAKPTADFQLIEMKK